MRIWKNFPFIVVYNDEAPELWGGNGSVKITYDTIDPYAVTLEDQNSTSVWTFAWQLLDDACADETHHVHGEGDLRAYNEGQHSLNLIFRSGADTLVATFDRHEIAAYLRTIRRFCPSPRDLALRVDDELKKMFT